MHCGACPASCSFLSSFPECCVTLGRTHLLSGFQSIFCGLGLGGPHDFEMFFQVWEDGVKLGRQNPGKQWRASRRREHVTSCWFNPQRSHWPLLSKHFHCAHDMLGPVTAHSRLLTHSGTSATALTTLID